MSILLNKLDFYGIRTQLYIDKSSKFKSSFGGFLSLILIGSGFILFILLGKDMLHGENPEISSSEIFNPQPSSTAIGKNGYFFLFGLEDSSYIHFYDESIYQVIMQQVIITSNETSSIREVKDIPFERCSEDHLPDDMKSYFLRAPKGSNIQNLICVRKGYELDIEGTFDSSNYKFVYLFVKSCSNNTNSNITCKPQKEIDEKLQQSFFAFYSTDFLINGRNYENPGVKIGRDYFISTTPNIQKSCVKYLASQILLSDEGWILNNEKKFNYSVFSYDKESFEIRSYTQNEAKTLIDFVIRKSAYEKIHRRKYKKLHNVFADMGGFMNIIFFLLYLISLPINSKLYYQVLANKLFNFEKDEEILKSKNENLNCAKTILEEINIEKTKPFENVKVKNQKEKVLQELFKSQDIPLKLTSWSIIKSYFRKNEKLQCEMKQRESAMENIFEYLDISYVLKKVLEIEKLKILLLNEDQYHLFELMPKPLVRKNGTIQLNSNKIKLKNSEILSPKDIIANNKDHIWQAQMIRNAYDNINHKKEKNEVDERLLRLIDEDLKTFFQETLKNKDFKKNKILKATITANQSEMESVESEDAKNMNKIENYI